MQHAGARRPQHQPLSAAAGGRDSSLRDGDKSDVLHPDTNSKPARVSAEMFSQPEPREFKGTFKELLRRNRWMYAWLMNQLLMFYSINQFETNVRVARL